MRGFEECKICGPTFLVFANGLINVGEISDMRLDGDREATLIN